MIPGINGGRQGPTEEINEVANARSKNEEQRADSSKRTSAGSGYRLSISDAWPGVRVLQISSQPCSQHLQNQLGRGQGPMQTYLREQSGLTAPRSSTGGHGKPTDYSSTAHAQPATRMPWQDRLAELAHLASVSLGTDSRERDTAPTIHYHLDAIETILRDPRPELTQEISRCRRSRSRSLESPLGLTRDSRGAKAMMPLQIQRGAVNEEEMSAQLTVLLKEVSALNTELRQRHKESIEIRDMFEARCRGLSRTITELEDEVFELHADLVEDAVESEGIQGTVLGLQDWIDGLRETQKESRMLKDLARHKGRRYWGGRKGNEELVGETGDEMVLDGLSAWMRGWRDVADGFQVRARARKTRRERRQEQFSRPSPGSR
ncbi:uncharacterized protein N7459_009994 [Penicillium hispanicum]|uniref:uncharacterized protein n=1 Tax=Penicillium hispanicum TaxID=1080232 RepID=UPI0025420CDF|nr:uncharacterized protein N7459_009994 [Penicillium hispanicum]KAJ5570564.1 hypothetical protein N7459_009994 [Penicillium hispanicum]